MANEGRFTCHPTPEVEAKASVVLVRGVALLCGVVVGLAC